MDRSTQLGTTELLLGPESTAVRAAILETSQTATVATVPETVAPKTDAAFLNQEHVPQSLAMPQTVSVSPAPETATPKTDAASLQEQVPQMMQGLAAPQMVEQSAAGQAQTASEEAKLQTADVEILAKIPVARPRPTAAPTRKSTSVLPSVSAGFDNATVAADPTSLTTLLTPALNLKGEIHLRSSDIHLLRTSMSIAGH